MYYSSVGTFGSSAAVSLLPAGHTNSTFTQHMPAMQTAISPLWSCLIKQIWKNWVGWNPAQSLPSVMHHVVFESELQEKGFCKSRHTSTVLLLSLQWLQAPISVLSPWRFLTQSNVVLFPPQAPHSVACKADPRVSRSPSFDCSWAISFILHFQRTVLVGYRILFLLTFILVLEFSTGVEYMVESLFLSAFRVFCHAFWTARFGWELLVLLSIPRAWWHAFLLYSELTLTLSVSSTKAHDPSVSSYLSARNADVQGTIFSSYVYAEIQTNIYLFFVRLITYYFKMFWHSMSQSCLSPSSIPPRFSPQPCPDNFMFFLSLNINPLNWNQKKQTNRKYN